MTVIEDDAEAMALHDRQARAVAAAVAHLVTDKAPAGFTPEAIAQGAIDGAAVVLFATTPMTPADFADLLETIAENYRHLGKPNLTVVQ